VRFEFGEVAAELDVGLDNCLTAESDVRGAGDLGAAGDLVARVLKQRQTTIRESPCRSVILFEDSRPE